MRALKGNIELGYFTAEALRAQRFAEKFRKSTKFVSLSLWSGSRQAHIEALSKSFGWPFDSAQGDSRFGFTDSKTNKQL